MKYLYYIAFGLIFAAPIQAKKPPSSTSDQSARAALKQALKSYHLKSAQIAVQQEIFLSPIKMKIKSQGFLDIQEKKFRLDLTGQSSSLILFDGQWLWYQPDKLEKTAFKLKNPPAIQMLSHFFDESLFFKSFQIKKTVKTGKNYVFQAEPIKKIEGWDEMFIKIGAYVLEIRITQEELNNWHKYKFSKPVYKKFFDKHFQFPTEGFQLITKT